MPNNTNLIDRPGNLHHCPVVIDHQSTHISIGDLHGNTLKLLYFLVEEGVWALSKDDYDKLYTIYMTPTVDLRASDLLCFNDIIERAEITKKDINITLLGDELADRGDNDYFTLLVLRKLREAAVNIEIILSNHGIEFLRNYEQRRFSGNVMINPEQASSLKNMCSLLRMGLLNEADVRQLVKEDYIPLVKAISYTVSEEGELTLFTHAPVGLETIKAVADRLHIPYKDDSLKALVKTIDSINNEINERLVKRTLMKEIDKNLVEWAGLLGENKPLPLEYPLQRLTWNSVLGDELQMKTSSGLTVKCFVHGHIGPDPLKKDGVVLASHQNLDSYFGKTIPDFKTNNIDVRHVTRHSQDLCANELNDDVLDALDYKSQFNDCLNSLSQVIKELSILHDKDGPDFDQNYEFMVKMAEQLKNNLQEIGKQFFSREQLKQFDYQGFSVACQKVINEVKEQLTAPLVKRVVVEEAALSFLAPWGMYPRVSVSKVTHVLAQSIFKPPSATHSLKLEAVSLNEFCQAFEKTMLKSTEVKSSGLTP